MRPQSAFRFLGTAGCLVLATVAACDYSPSAVSEGPRPSTTGQWFTGDDAIAKVQQLLRHNVHTLEILRSPQGARFAAAQGLALDDAITSTVEQIAYYNDVLANFSGEASIGLHEEALRRAQETSAMLKSSQGREVAAELGMTLEAAHAAVQKTIEGHTRILAAHGRQLRFPALPVAAAGDECDSPASLWGADLGLRGPRYDRNAEVTTASISAYQHC